jgi:hypothetical protein
MQTRYTALIKIILSIIMLVLSLPVLAGGENYWITEDRIRLAVGGYFPKIDTQVRISNDQGQGTLIDLEDDFGLDDSVASLRIQGHYRFNSEHRFIYSFIDASRDASHVVERDIIYDDKIFPAGSLVTADFSVQLIKLLYGYSFLQNDKIDLSFTAGMVGLDLDTTLDSPLVDREEDSSFLPLPVVGLRGMYAYNRKLLLRAGIDYFKINEGNVDAEVIDWNLAIEYDVFKKVALGLSYGQFNLDGEKKSDNDKFDFDIEGFFVYAKFGFE